MEDQIKDMLKDPLVSRLVKIIDLASLSMLELLEFGVTQKEINHALASRIIAFDKPPREGPVMTGQPAGGDYYFEFLNSKVKLTELGIHLLQRIRENK